MRSDPASGRDCANVGKLQTHYFLLYSVHISKPVFSPWSVLEIRDICTSVIRFRRSRTSLLFGWALPDSGYLAKSDSGRSRNPDSEFCSFFGETLARNDRKRSLNKILPACFVRNQLVAQKYLRRLRMTALGHKQPVAIISSERLVSATTGHSVQRMRRIVRRHWSILNTTSKSAPQIRKNADRKFRPYIDERPCGVLSLIRARISSWCQVGESP